jgi:hypothetical protein
LGCVLKGYGLESIFFELIFAMVCCNSEEPCFEGGVLAKFTEGAVCFDERFLGGVPCGFSVVEKVIAQGIDLVSIFTDQLLEGGFGAGLCLGDQGGFGVGLGLGNFLRHWEVCL